MIETREEAPAQVRSIESVPMPDNLRDRFRAVQPLAGHLHPSILVFRGFEYMRVEGLRAYLNYAASVGRPKYQDEMVTLRVDTEEEGRLVAHVGFTAVGRISPDVRIAEMAEDAVVHANGYLAAEPSHIRFPELVPVG